MAFNNQGTYSFDSLEIIEVPMVNYEEKIKKLQNNQMTDIVYGKDFIKGNIDIESNGILQLTTSYSKGWKVYVDGIEKDIIKANCGFVGVEVEKGTHKVEFKYKTPYIDLGIIFSIIGLIGFVFLCLKEK